MSSEEKSASSNSVNETYGFSPELMDQLVRDNEIYNNPNRPKTTFTAGEKQEFPADDIRVKVSAFIRDIEEFVEKWELCGGIRRGNPTAHDADVVVWVKWLHNPENMMSLQHKLADVAAKYQQEGSVKFIEEILKAEQKPKRKSSKPAKPKPPRKNYRFMYDGIKFDVWVCLNEQQFEVQKLIRTGSRDFGHLLASRAQEYKETAQRPDGSTYETKGGCIKFGHDPFFDQDFYGFYGACVSDDTECLTLEGWKKRQELKVGEIIATYNMDTHRVEYKPLKDLHVYNYSGEIHEIAGKILVTSNHRNVVSRLHTTRQDGTDKRKRTRQETIVTTEALAITDLFRIAAPHDYVENCGVGGDDFAALIGWILAEGSYVKSQSTGKVERKVTNILIKQNEGQYSDEIRKLLRNLNMDWREDKWTGKTGRLEINFSIKGPIAEKIRVISPDKKLNRFLSELPKSELRSMFEALLKGDGTQRRPYLPKGGYRRNGGNWTFSQKDKQNANWFQIIALRLGYHSLLTQDSEGMHHVYVNPRQYLGMQYNNRVHRTLLKKVDYNGIVWCPEVENGTWICRRDGYPMITGNSFGWVKNEETGKSKQGMIVNPARLLAWRENDIILKVFGDVEGLQYLDPANRNIEFTAGATTATGVSEGNFDGGESSYE